MPPATRCSNGQPALAERARATGETVSWVELDDEIVVVANIPSARDARAPAGGQLPRCRPRRGGPWQAEPAQLDAIFRRLGQAERDRLPVSDSAGLQAWLKRSCRAGHVLTERHLDAQGVSVSAPVFDVQGRVAAAINISTLKSRHDVLYAASSCRACSAVPGIG
jgi:IclR family pca regulon transcriptional regulator